MKTKLRWFYTSSGKRIIAGKSAEQNEQVMKEAHAQDIIMHTRAPGSPFCIIHGKANAKDLQETAIFCASFSQGWKKKRHDLEVHIFRGEQVCKDKKMKTGTFSVLGDVKKVKVKLELWLGFQDNKLRAAAKSCFKEPLMKLEPGNVDKAKAAVIIKERLSEQGISVVLEDILQAIPAGGFKL